MPNDIPVVQPGPIAIAPASDDIAAFLAEGHKPDSSEAPEGEVESTETADETSTDDSDTTTDTDDNTDTSDTKETKVKLPSDSVDFAKLVEALDTKDVATLMEALGPLADEMLSSKSHKTLRLQAKDLKIAQKAAQQAEEKANELIDKLSNKYSDPIEVRKAIDSKDPGAVDKFIDYAEKTTGATWNDIIRWVVGGMAGRQTRLQQKAVEAETASVKNAQSQAEALEQAKTWVSGAVTKVDAALLTEAPEIVDLIINEIKTGYSKGITSPAKALPLAMAKLKDQHDRLTKLFARKNKKATPAPAVSAKVGTNADNNKPTRVLSVDEEIAAFKKELGIK